MPKPAPNAAFASLLQRALAAHQAGKLAEARRDYELALKLEAQNPTLLQLFGMLLAATGELERGIEMLRRCVALQPNYVEAWSMLGNALLSQNKLVEALDAHTRAVAAKPNMAELHCNRGLSQQRLGQIHEAIASFREALRLKPAFPEALNNLGNLLKQQGQLNEAVATYRQALKVCPDYAVACLHLANTLHELKRHDEAEEACRRALQLRPGMAEGYNSLGLILAALGRQEAAIEAYRKALALEGNLAEAWSNLGSSLQRLNQLEAAIQAYREALQCDPKHFESLCNLGNALNAQNQVEAGVLSYQQALALQPNSAEVAYNLGLALLALGRLEEAWPHYERRWETKERVRRELRRPEWTGSESLAGKTLLLHAEQGLGDTLQFLRYVPLLAAKGARVVVELQAPLKELIATQPGLAAVVGKREPLPDFDFHCALMSLPKCFGTTLSSIPDARLGIQIPSTSLARWSTYFSGIPERKVGLVWSGNPLHRNDHNRSLPLEKLAPLFELQGLRFFCIQKDIRPSDTEYLRTTACITALSSQLENFCDTAAIIRQLDCVISVDTSVAHLAGALGARTYLLLPYSADWRWLLERSDSPWYPSLQLLRQPRVGDWETVIDQIKSLLAPAH